MRIKPGIVVLIASLTLALFLSPAAHAQVVKGQGLLEAGPLPTGSKPPVSLFPSWFMDKNGAALELCLDGPPLCLSSLAEFSNPDIGEAFYWSATADLTHPSGANGLVEFALEAAFLNPAQTRANAMVFNRLRIRLSGLQAGGQYTMVHPFGRHTFTAVADPKGGFRINDTLDIPGAAGPTSYKQVLRAPNIGPFLKQTTAPAGHLGSPNLFRPVTGGPNGNSITITGPAGFTLTTNRFAVEGKIATNGGLSRVRANYSRDATGAGTLNVFASSVGLQTIAADRPLLPRVRLKAVAGQVGEYAAAIPFTATQAFEPVTVRNFTDAGKPSVTMDQVPDIVTITTATFTPGAAGQPGTLTVKASSSDLFAPRPQLQLLDEAGNLLRRGRGALNFVLSTPIKPVRVQVTSAAGGSASANVQTVP